MMQKYSQNLHQTSVSYYFLVSAIFILFFHGFSSFANPGFLDKQVKGELLPAGALIFSKNVGQLDPFIEKTIKIAYETEVPGTQVYFGAAEIYYCSMKGMGKDTKRASDQPPVSELEYSQYKVSFDGARSVMPDGGTEVETKINYIIAGNNFSNIPSSNSITYKNLYKEIDLTYYGTEAKLKYDFIVRPGGDVTQIKMKYTGVEALNINSHGELELKTSFGIVKEGSPYSYQLINGRKQEVKVNFKKLPEQGKQTIGFEICGDYDPSQELIIDPYTLLWSTYVGIVNLSYAGGKNVWLADIVVDNCNNTYGTGNSYRNFPTTSNNINANCAATNSSFMIVFKLNASANTLLYATYIVGTTGSFGISAWVIDVNATGQAVVGGTTYSANFPLPPGAFQPNKSAGSDTDVIIFKISANGDAILYGSYLGGPNSFALCGEFIGDIKVRDESGTEMIYAVGATCSASFPVTAGAYQTVPNPGGYLTKFKPAGTGVSDIVYSTYIVGGGATGVAIDNSNDIYIVGNTVPGIATTASAYQSAIAGGRDAYFIKISPDGLGALDGVYATMIGGSGDEYTGSIDVDNLNRAYISGETTSSNFPTYLATQGAHGGNFDVFVCKFDPSLSGAASLLYSSFLGGSGDDRSGGLALNQFNEIWLVGGTSGNFPLTADAFQPAYGGGGWDLYLTQINIALPGLKYSTYMGGNQVEGSYSYSSLHVSDNNQITVGASSGSNNFITTPGVLQPTKATTTASTAGVIFRFQFTPPTLIAAADTVCAGQATNFNSMVTGGVPPYTYNWSGEAGFSSTTANPTFTYTAAGTYKVNLSVKDAQLTYALDKCLDTIFTFYVTVKTAPSIEIGSSTLCPQSCIQLTPLSSNDTIIHSFESNDLLVIPNNVITGVSASITVNGITPTVITPGLIKSVCMNIDHAYIGDITILLTSPAGTTITLSSNNGVGACICNRDYQNTCFSPTAAVNITAATPSFTGEFQPEQSFNAFTGENVNGIWTLKVIDEGASVIGNLLNWNINFQTYDAADYLWSPSTFLSDPTIVNPVLCPPGSTTSYTLLKSLSNGCSDIDTVIVTAPPVISVNSPTICASQTATLTASGADTYSWSNGASTNPITVSPATTSTYTVTGTSGGCTGTAVATVSVSSNAALTLISAPGSDLQNVCVNASISPITYSISGGGTGATVSGLPPGISGSFSGGIFNINGMPSVDGVFNYTVTTTGFCTQTSASGTISVSPLPVITSVPFTNESSCGAGDGTLTINATGSGLSYSINGGSTYSAGNFFSNLNAGSYQVMVQNINGCTQNGGTISISGSSSIPTPVANANPNPVCAGDDLLLFVSSPNGGETYSWSGPGGFTASGDSVTILNVNSSMAGVYTVAANAGGCLSAGGSVTVSISSLSTITLSSTASTENQVLCLNTPLNTIVYNVSGTGAGATVTGLAPGLTSSFSSGIFTISGTPNNSGTYNYLVNVSGTCNMASESGSVNVNPDAAINLTSAPATEAQTLCINSAISPISYSISGGGSGATVSGLPPGLNGNFSGGVLSINGTVTASGGFSYSVTTTGTCAQASESGTFTINNAPNPVINGNAGFCTGGSTTLSATASAAGSGIITSYQWQFNGSNIVGQTASTYTASNPGSYSVVITNSQGCSSTSAPFLVSQNQSPTATISGSGTICPGSSSILSASTSLPGSGTITGYQWQLGGNNISGATSSSYTAISAGSYNVIVFNSMGCSATSSTMVVSTAPAPTAIVSGPNSFCTNDSTVLSAVSSTAGSGSITDYQWFLNGTSIGGATASDLIVFSGGNYSVLVTNSGGCTNTSAEYPVTMNALPSPVISGASSICAGTSTTLTVSNSGTGGAIAYQWYLNGSSISSATTNSLVVNSAGNYSAAIIDNNGCSATSFLTTLTMDAAPTAVVTGTNSFCSGSGTMLSGTSSTPGSGTIINYQWALDGNNIGTNSGSFFANSGGLYTLIVTNSFGCTTTSNPFAINVISNPVVSVNSASICPGDSVLLSAVVSPDGGIFSWSGGGTGSNFMAGPSASTTYTVSYTVSSCTSAATATVTVVSIPDANFNSVITSNEVQFNNFSSNSVAWLWNFGDPSSGLDNFSTLQSPSHNFAQTGTFNVTLYAANSNGCLDSISMLVTIEGDFSFYIPNAFSPDDDGVNDEFFAKGNNIDEFEMSIYDRWGHLVFYTDQIDRHWNGNSKSGNEPAPMGTYVYKISLKAGQDRSQKNYLGIVTLCR